MLQFIHPGRNSLRWSLYGVWYKLRFLNWSSPHFSQSFMQCWINCQWRSVPCSIWVLYIECFKRHADVNSDWRKYRLYCSNSLSIITSILKCALFVSVRNKDCRYQKFRTVINREKYYYTIFLVQNFSIRLLVLVIYIFVFCLSFECISIYICTL